MLVRDIMTSPVAVAEPGTTLASAYAVMQERGFRHLPVERGGQLAGVVTDRDLRLATSALASRPFPADARVDEVVSRPVHAADPVEEGARTMRRLKVGCVPVVSRARLAGIATGVDPLDALLRLTGVLSASGLVEVDVEDRPGGRRLVLRLETDEVQRIAGQLRDEGFAVIWPAEASAW